MAEEKLISEKLVCIGDGKFRLVYTCRCCGTICREDKVDGFGDVIETIYDETYRHGWDCELR